MQFWQARTGKNYNNGLICICCSLLVAINFIPVRIKPRGFGSELITRSKLCQGFLSLALPDKTFALCYRTFRKNSYSFIVQVVEIMTYVAVYSYRHISFCHKHMKYCLTILAHLLTEVLSYSVLVFSSFL